MTGDSEMIHSADKRQPDMTGQPASAQCLSKRRLTGLRLSTCILGVPSLSRHARGKAAPLRGPLHDMKRKMASLVIVGRPNVGKSTLFNRLTGTRRSIVTNESGITRDRIYGKAEWRGRALEILRQAHLAIKKAALLVLVVDSRAGLTPLDEELARLLRTTGKPFVIAVNKVDAMSQESNAGVFHRIGVPIFPIAAEHGTGVDDLLDAALAQVSVVASVEEEKQPAIIEVAIIGRPNVGKSTLLNRMVGEEGVTQGDGQIASYAEESSRSVVIVINKWDVAVVAARIAASRDAATAKGKSKRAPGERHKPENFDSGRLMFDYEKMIRAKLK